MKFNDLREFIAFLEQKGELHRITTPVSCELEIAEIADRGVKRGGPAPSVRERQWLQHAGPD